jgi:hypothetical protein
MDPAEKKRILDAILKNAGQGEFGLDSFMQRDPNPIKDIYKANNLQESAMGKLALEQFKGKIPNVRTNQNELQDFAEGLREQFLPDVKSKIEIAPGMEGYGSFSPKKDLIQLNPKRSATDFSADLLHEGLHSRDLKANDYGSIGRDLAPGKSLNMKLKSLAPELVDEAGNILDVNKMKQLIKSADINDLKEILLKGHHGLKRGATVAQANIPRLLKGLPVLGAAGAALLSQDASAAVPLLNEADEVGESPADERQMLAEIEAKKAYNKSPAKLARLQALMGRK